MRRPLFLISFLLGLILMSCKEKETRPNIILIMADDMGYECLSAYGSTSYKTPNLDMMASKGVLFSSCVSQPLCTPSRVKIMTGQYNYNNYDYFGHLKTSEQTFGHVMKDAGYATCIAGKWQLNGLAYKDKISDWDDNSKPNKLGFEEYCLWQLTKTGREGGRYANPLIEQNGAVLNLSPDDYGPDVFANYITDFIERKKDQPFFVYYPMVLVHDPFVPTPDSETWEQKDIRKKNDTTYFKDMVAYTDKIVGQIQSKLEALNIADNTILIFTGDNGTHPTIYSNMPDRVIRGAKGNTIDAGTHVPLVISWPGKIKEGFVYNDLIEFSDFLPTFADAAKVEVNTIGKSFYPILEGEEYHARENAFVHYDPKWGKNVNKHRNRFVRTLNYKLYQDGEFFNLANDIDEKRPLHQDSLSDIEQLIRGSLEKELKKHPNFE